MVFKKTVLAAASLCLIASALSAKIASRQDRQASLAQNVLKEIQQDNITTLSSEDQAALAQISNKQIDQLAKRSLKELGEKLNAIKFFGKKRHYHQLGSSLVREWPQARERRMKRAFETLSDLQKNSDEWALLGDTQAILIAMSKGMDDEYSRADKRALGEKLNMTSSTQAKELGGILTRDWPKWREERRKEAANVIGKIRGVTGLFASADWTNLTDREQKSLVDLSNGETIGFNAREQLGHALKKCSDASAQNFGKKLLGEKVEAQQTEQ